MSKLEKLLCNKKYHKIRNINPKEKVDKESCNFIDNVVIAANSSGQLSSWERCIEEEKMKLKETETKVMMMQEKCIQPELTKLKQVDTFKKFEIVFIFHSQTYFFVIFIYLMCK